MVHYGRLVDIYESEDGPRLTEAKRLLKQAQNALKAEEEQ